MAYMLSAWLSMEHRQEQMFATCDCVAACLAAKPRDWQAQVKGLPKAEVKRRNLSYADLADKLSAVGVRDNKRNISIKIGRGTFTAVFLIQCLTAIGCNTLHCRFRPIADSHSGALRTAERAVAIQSLSDARLIHILQLDDSDDDGPDSLRRMVEAAIARRKKEGRQQ
jgi:Domain of unknown function (DUF6471)